MAWSVVSSSGIDLAWQDTASNEIGFGIERCSGTTCAVTFVEVATVGANATSYQNTGLLAATSYCVPRARPAAGWGVGVFGHRRARPRRRATGSLAAPSNLAATAVSTSQINLTWTDNATNETGFKIESEGDRLT